MNTEKQSQCLRVVLGLRVLMRCFYFLPCPTIVIYIITVVLYAAAKEQLLELSSDNANGFNRYLGTGY